MAAYDLTIIGTKLITGSRQVQEAEVSVPVPNREPARYLIAGQPGSVPSGSAHCAAPDGGHGAGWLDAGDGG